MAIHVHVRTRITPPPCPPTTTYARSHTLPPNSKPPPHNLHGVQEPTYTLRSRAPPPCTVDDGGGSGSPALPQWMMEAEEVEDPAARPLVLQLYTPRPATPTLYAHVCHRGVTSRALAHEQYGSRSYFSPLSPSSFNPLTLARTFTTLPPHRQPPRTPTT